MSGEMFRRTKGRDKRRQWGIQAYVGLNGSGKSLAMVWDTLPSLDAGRTVLSTVRLLDFRNPRRCDDPDCSDWQHDQPNGHGAAHPSYVPFRTWEQLMEHEHGDVLMDEIVGLASSRESQSLPTPVANYLMQLRRRDVVLRWTAPNWARADTIIRETTQAVTQCRGFMAVTTRGSDRLWRPRRMFSWRTYDRAEFSEFSDGNRQHLKAMVKNWHWGPGSHAQAGYDTLDVVSTVGTTSESGRCLSCGGRRAVPACKCDDTGRGHGRPVKTVGPPQGVPALPGGGDRDMIVDSDCGSLVDLLVSVGESRSGVRLRDSARKSITL